MIQTSLPSAGAGESLGGGTLVPAYSLSRFALAAATPESPPALAPLLDSSDEESPQAICARQTPIVATHPSTTRRPRVARCTPIDYLSLARSAPTHDGARGGAAADRGSSHINRARGDCQAECLSKRFYNIESLSREPSRHGISCHPW